MTIWLLTITYMNIQRTVFDELVVSNKMVNQQHCVLVTIFLQYLYTMLLYIMNQLKGIFITIWGKKRSVFHNLTRTYHIQHYFWIQRRNTGPWTNTLFRTRKKIIMSLFCSMKLLEYAVYHKQDLQTISKKTVVIRLLFIHCN